MGMYTYLDLLTNYYVRLFLQSSGGLRGVGRGGASGGCADRRGARAQRRLRAGGSSPGGPAAPVDDTTADRQNFGKMSLVFGCIGTELCKQIRVFQHFSKIYQII